MIIHMRKKNNLTILFLAILSVLFTGCTTPSTTNHEDYSNCAAPGDDLQAILDSGSDLILLPGKTYDISNTLKYTQDGQIITTRNAKFISDFATLRLVNKESMLLIDGAHKNAIVLSNVIIDGNRYKLSVVAKNEVTGGGGQPPLVFFGGTQAKSQRVASCVFMSTRTWSTLKIHEGATDCIVKNNIFLGAGVDPRGNGREKQEIPFNWGDAISCAAEKTTILNNLMLDPTDVGIVLYGAPGTIADNNVIASISRESLGAINMVDGIDYYKINELSNEEITAFDFRDVKIRNNLIDVFGARIHMAVPMGCSPWVPNNFNKVLVGAEVSNNKITGDAGGYGFIVSGVKDFKVVENINSAKYSGRADGLSPDNPADPPGPFYYDSKHVDNCTLQPEFFACERHLEHLLRCNHGPTNELGYRVYPYGEYEAAGVINAAFLEMLRRSPSPEEINSTTKWLQEEKATADQLRRKLMASGEFVANFGNVAPDELHPYRTQLWMNILDSIQRRYFEKQGIMPSAKELYNLAKKELRK